jgi:hypothetical protein
MNNISVKKKKKIVFEHYRPSDIKYDIKFSIQVYSYRFLTLKTVNNMYFTNI